jgi:hypothetical protein
MTDRSPQIRVTAAQTSSPLAGEEGARRAAVGRRGGRHDLLPLAKRMRREPDGAGGVKAAIVLSRFAP